MSAVDFERRSSQDHQASETQLEVLDIGGSRVAIGLVLTQLTS
jgi:hypothetical protein